MPNFRTNCLLVLRYIVREWGVPKSREAMLTGRSIPVSELHVLSAVHYVLPDLESALEKVDQVVEQLSLGAPLAIADIKNLVNSAATEPAKEHAAVIKAFFLEMLAPSVEGKYGLECFQAKEKPDWVGLHKGKENLK
jgi:enoyl-CoA hydratase/carnithine racemase